MRSYLPLGERIGAAEHQQPAPALADEIAQQCQLVGREEAGFEIVDHDRVVTVELVGRFGKAVAELDSVGLVPSRIKTGSSARSAVSASG